MNSWSSPRFIRIWVVQLHLILIFIQIIALWKPIFFILSLNIKEWWWLNIIFWLIIINRYHALIRIRKIVNEFKLSLVFIFRIDVKQPVNIQVFLMNLTNRGCLIDSFCWLKRNLILIIFTSFIELDLSLKIEVWESDSWMVSVLYFLHNYKKLPLEPKSLELEIASLEF